MSQPLGQTETEHYKDNEYVSRSAGEPIGVQSDDAKVEDPIDPEQADTDAQLGMSSLSFSLSFSLPFLFLLSSFPTITPLLVVSSSSIVYHTNTHQSAMTRRPSIRATLLRDAPEATPSPRASTSSLARMTLSSSKAFEAFTIRNGKLKCKCTG